MTSEQESAPAAKEGSVPGIITDKITELTCEKCGCKIDVSDVQPFVKIECPDCHNAETVPAKLGHFTLLHLIGTGGMGGVYYAKDDSLGRFVAIKVMLESLGKDQDFIETFKREAQAVAKLNHPHIAQIYSFGTEKNQPYIVMELVAGRRFDKMIASGEELDQGIVMKIGLEIAEALSAADEIGLIHGDIKPENILLDEKWSAKLVDFGLASFVGQTAEEGIWGTPYYIAPEKVRRQKVDARSDIYSLGAALYHALAGRPPFEGTTPVEVVKARLTQEPAPIHLYRKNINDVVESIVMRMLQGQPARRYPNYASLVSDLRSIVKELGADRKNYAARMNRKTVKLLVSKKPALQVGTKAQGSAEPGTKHISISKQGKKRTTSFVVTAGTTRSIDDASLDDVENPELESSVLDAYKRRKLEAAAAADIASEKRVKVVLWIALLLILGLVGYELVSKALQRNRRENESRRALIALQEEIKSANDIYATLHVAATNIVAMETPVRILAESATNIVYLAIHQTIDRPAQTNEPEIMLAARKVVAEVAKAHERAQLARQSDAAALTIKDDTVKALDPGHARIGVDKLTELLAAVSAAGKEARLALANADQASADVNAIQARLYKETKEQQEKNALELKQRQEMQAIEERKAAIQAEIKTVDSAQEECMPLVSQHRYQEAAAKLATRSRELKSDEGKNALSAAIERYNRLQNLKLFVIERLNAEQFPWGYYDPDTRGALDVLGADEKEVRVRGKNVAWTTISVAQMKKFIDRVLASEKLTTKVQAEQNFAAAIFTVVNGGEKVAKPYLDKALDLSPALKNDAKQLLPSLQ